MKKLVKTALGAAGLELRRRPDPQLPFPHEIEVDGETRSFWIANSQTKEWWGSAELEMNSEFRELTRLCSPGSTVLEVGAHHGMMTLLLSRCAGPEGHVLAIEASADNVLVLEANCFRNRVSNVSTHFLACGANDGLAQFGGESLAAASGTRRTVKMQTVDNFCAEQNLQHVDLLKVDVEGFEHDVFAGASDLLRQGRPKIALELHVDLLREAGSSAKQVWAILESADLLNDRPIHMLARPDWNTLKPIERFEEIPNSGVANLFIG
ncbi:MAG: hypothetical protein Fues2KO_26160 [Fuerstiella sp.]